MGTVDLVKRTEPERDGAAVRVLRWPLRVLAVAVAVPLRVAWEVLRLLVRGVEVSGRGVAVVVGWVVRGVMWPFERLWRYALRPLVAGLLHAAYAAWRAVWPWAVRALRVVVAVPLKALVLAARWLWRGLRRGVRAGLRVLGRTLLRGLRLLGRGLTALWRVAAWALKTLVGVPLRALWRWVLRPALRLVARIDRALTAVLRVVLAPLGWVGRRFAAGLRAVAGAAGEALRWAVRAVLAPMLHALAGGFRTAGRGLAGALRATGRALARLLAGSFRRAWRAVRVIPEPLRWAWRGLRAVGRVLTAPLRAAGRWTLAGLRRAATAVAAPLRWGLRAAALPLRWAARGGRRALRAALAPLRWAARGARAAARAAAGPFRAAGRAVGASFRATGALSRQAWADVRRAFRLARR